MRAGPNSQEDIKTHKKRADRAYVEAMRGWLDHYHQQVAMPSGLARLGPGRRRLTRAEWQREKVQATALQLTMRRAKAAQDRAIRFVNKAKEAACDAQLKAAEAEQLHNRHIRAARKAIGARSKATHELEATKASTRRLHSLGGQVRAAFDGFQTSRIAQSIATEFRKQIEALRTALKSAQQDLANELQRRRALEQKLTAASASVHELAVARDQALAKLRKLQRSLETKPSHQPAGYQFNRKEFRP